MALFELYVDENGEIQGIKCEEDVADELEEKIGLVRCLWERAAHPFSLVNRQKYQAYQEAVGDIDAFCQVARSFINISRVLHHDLAMIMMHKTPESPQFYDDFLKLLHSFFSTTCWYLNHDDINNVMRSPLGLVCGKRQYEKGERRLLKISADDLIELLDFCENTGLQEEYYPPYYGIEDEDEDEGEDDEFEDDNDNPAERAGEIRAPLVTDYDDDIDSGMDDPFVEDADYDEDDDLEE